MFTEEINKIRFKRIQSIHTIETYSYGMRKDLKYKKEETKYNDIIKQCKKLLT